MILLIDNYDSFTFNLYQYIRELGAECEVVRNDELTCKEIFTKKPARIIISPGPGNPDSAGISLEIVTKSQGQVPILGVCLGHQAIGQAFGGKIIKAPKMMHGKVSKITHKKCGVFNGLPSPLKATRYHSLMIAKKSFPKALEVTAKSEDGVIMGVRHRDWPIQGVQFHPESIMTEHGKKILKNFLEDR